MSSSVDFKRILSVFANRGHSLAALCPALAQLRLNLRLRLTQKVGHWASVDESDPVELSSNSADADFKADTECVFQLQELLYSESAGSDSVASAGQGGAVCLAGKLHLLLLLQENADALVRSQKGLVQLLAFLLDLTKSQQHPVHLTAQAMVCCCSLMIGRDLLRDEHQLCSKFISHLLDLTGGVNSIHNMLLRFRALQCLIALEDAYPCLLSKKLDYFYQFCTSERTYLSEFYYSLFSLLLVHVFDSSMKDSGSWSDDRLSSRVDALAALSLSSIQPLRGRHSLMTSSPPAAGSSSPELTRAVGHLIAALDAGRLSSLAFAAVCRCVGRLLQAVGDEGRGLRTAFYRRLPNWDAVVLSALAGLRQRFGLEALGCCDDLGGDWLALTMQRVACYPLFPTPLRLLMCHYLAAYPHLRVCQGRDSFPEPASRQLVSALFPGVFDPVDLRVLKVRLLSLRFAPRDSSDEASACLMGTLVSLSRPAQKSGGRGRHAVAFFASLYAVFARHHASVLGEDIRQMLISMINANLAFTDHLLDFLDCVGQDFPGSDLPYQAYAELCDWVAISSLENAVDRQSLSRYMAILNQAAMYNRIAPQPIVDFLVQLAASSLDTVDSVDDVNGWHGDTSATDASAWLCGHLVLDVCRSIFRTHWARLHSDPALLASLCSAIAHWAGVDGDGDNGGCQEVDVDVRSRAQLYYSLACHMSPQKLASIVFESAAATAAVSPSDSNSPQLIQQQLATTDRTINPGRTRTSLAVTAPPASQSMPEMRALAESPIDLAIMPGSMVQTDSSRGSTQLPALLVPVRLTCRRTRELFAETDLLAIDLTFSTHSDSNDYSIPAVSEADAAIASVDPVHLPRLHLPPMPSAEDADIAEFLSANVTELNLQLRVICRRPLPCRLAVRLDCTAGVECRPLTVELSPLRLGLSELLQPLPSNDQLLTIVASGKPWCPLDRPGASFMRCPTGSATAAADKLARFRLFLDAEATATSTTVPTATSTTVPTATATSTTVPTATATSTTVPSATATSTTVPTATATSTTVPTATATSTVPTATATSTTVPMATETSSSEATVAANDETIATATTTPTDESTATSTSTAVVDPTTCWHYGFSVPPSCQLRLTVASSTVADVLTFCVIEGDTDSLGGDETARLMSRDAWQLLLHFDRFLKDTFGVFE